MTLETLAAHHRLKVRRDKDDTKVVGKFGHLYEHDDEYFGVLLMFSTVGRWNNARRRLEAAGCEILQNGETEGTAIFPRREGLEVTQAIREAKTPRKRLSTGREIQNLKRCGVGR